MSGSDESGQSVVGTDQVSSAEIFGPNSPTAAGGAYNLPVPRARTAWSLAAVLLVLTALGHVLGRPRARLPSPPEVGSGAFTSPQDCREALQAGQRLPRAAGSARFASWNLRWFPDGEPREGAGGTDLAWLACALAWLDVDVLAVQEIKQTPSAERALGQLLAELNRASGGRYVARLDDCGSRVTQHVGLVWNEARVSAGSVETVAALNPRGNACQDQLRPGLSAQVRLPGGLDLSVVSAHFKSKTDARAFALRGQSFAAVPGVVAALTARARDSDVLLLGDLNTMGCRSCTPQVSALEEQASVRQLLSGAGLSLLPADAGGTQLYGGRATLLDHAVAPGSMRELPAAARVHVAGFCAASDSKSGAADHARRRLSDHCPIVLDLTDRDLD
jgi:endonuclease/exonuclease/phosphatase family metal-dependent hydrolase